MSSLDPVLLQRLQSVLEAVPVRLAVLFGSRTTGHARLDSDFDIGILPHAAGLTLKQELGLAAALSKETGAEVDLVRLDQDNPLLGREVARDGVCLFEEQPGVFAAYRARAVSTWLDFDETVAPHRQAFLHRLASRRASGARP